MTNEASAVEEKHDIIHIQIFTLTIHKTQEVTQFSYVV